MRLWRPSSRGLLASGSALAILGGLGLGAGPADAAHARSQRAGVPAYWSVDTPAGAAFLDQLAAATPTVGTVVINGPTSSAPIPLHLPTAAAIARMHRAGARVLGYVDTGYLGTTGKVTTRVNPGSTAIADWQAQARLDVGDWYRIYGRYGLDGIFFDQTVSTCGTDNSFVDIYRALARQARAGRRGASVAVNPGTGAEECYARVADTIVIFENTYQEYLGWTPPAWVRRYPAGMFWHLVHSTPTRAEMGQAVALSKRRNAGQVFVTDDVIDPTGSPWDTLPAGYWRAELRQIAEPHRR